ncbi:tyrosine-type recombinase/integrase [Streptacidiphilus carbonis]|uniref:tyrosine-type recombinase/integrase n=1 Tax=Streptacidiphilus carbonis TaxID=105422 RepID=UPI0005A8CDC4|nr:site-specific integrase [Streptacidiphilus carbonis]
MGVSYNVQIWGIRKRPYSKPFQLRWQVGTFPKAESFLTKGLAESRRAQLVTAARAGEPFDEESGLPLSMLKGEEVSWYQHARNYIAMKWDDSPAKTRTTLAEAMATVTPALVKDTRGMPDAYALRTALYGWAFNKSRWESEIPEDVQRTLAWVERKSLPISALADSLTTRKALTALTKLLDGTTAAPSTTRRKRAIFHNAVGFALEAGHLTGNPLHRIQWKIPDVIEVVEPEVAVNPEQAAALLRAVREQGKRGRHLEAFFGCLYFAGMRPAEAVWLRRADCTLPRRGWGSLRLSETRPRVGSSWTDDGASHDKRGLKWRPRKAVRTVPIPPELVSLLRWHLERFGTEPDGRLFRTSRGGMVQESGYGAVWAEARAHTFTSPAQFKSPLGRRPYDLRHAAVSLWLNSGVDPSEVARRAGHSLAVLLRVYAKCLHGGEAAANDAISARLNRNPPPGSAR